METSVDPFFYFNIYSPVTSLSFCNVPDANTEGQKTLLLIGSTNGKVYQWNIKSRKAENEVDFSPEETGNPILWLCSIEQDNESFLAIQQRFSDKICLIKYSNYTWTQKKMLVLSDKHSGFCKGDLSLDDKLVFPCGENSFVIAKLIKGDSEELQSASSVVKTEGCGTLTALKFNFFKKKQCVFSLYENGDILLHSVVESNNEFIISTLTKYQSLQSTPLSIDFDSDKCKGIVGGSEDNITSFELVENNDKIVINLLKTRKTPTKGISSIIIRPDKKIVVAGSWDSTVKLFSWLHPEKLKPLGALKFHSEGIEDIVITSDSKLIAAGSKDGKISFWNVY